MTPDRGVVALVPFPFSDQSTAKRRPVLVVSRPDGYGDFVALPITSRPHHPRSIELSQDDLVEGSLPVRSWVRTDRPTTLNEELVVKIIARTAEDVVAKAVGALCAGLGEP